MEHLENELVECGKSYRRVINYHNDVNDNNTIRKLYNDGILTQGIMSSSIVEVIANTYPKEGEKAYPIAATIALNGRTTAIGFCRVYNISL